MLLEMGAQLTPMERNFLLLFLNNRLSIQKSRGKKEKKKKNRMQPISFIFILPAIPHPNTGHYSPFSIAYQGQESILLFFRHPSYRTTRNCGQNVYRAALKKPLLKKRTTPHDTTECGNNLTSQKSSTNEPQSTWGRWEMAGFHQVFERVHGEQKPKTSRNPHRRALAF